MGVKFSQCFQVMKQIRMPYSISFADGLQSKQSSFQNFVADISEQAMVAALDETCKYSKQSNQLCILLTDYRLE